MSYYILVANQMKLSSVATVPLGDHSVVQADGRDVKVRFAVGVATELEGKETFLSMEELLGTKGRLESLVETLMLTDLQVVFDKVPFVVQRYTGTLPPAYLDVTRLFGALTHPDIKDALRNKTNNYKDEQVLQHLLDQLNSYCKSSISGSGVKLVTPQNIEKIIDMLQETKKLYEGASEKVAFPGSLLLNETTKGLDSYNATRRKGGNWDYVISPEVRQNSEDDELWFRLPEIIQLEVTPPQALVPSESFANHYSSPIFKDPAYMMYVESGLSREEFIKFIKKPGGNKASIFEAGGYTPEDEIQFIEHKESTVLGDVENNLMGLQENEKSMHGALVNLAKSSIQEFLETNHLEVTEERVEEFYKKGIIPPWLQGYFEALIEYFLRAGWMHTGKLPFLVEGRDDEDDLIDSDDTQDSLLYQGVTGISSGFNPQDMNQVIAAELFRLAKENGVDIYVMTVIRLARWGNRKPTKLKLTDNCWIDLNRLMIGEESGVNVVQSPTLIDGKYLMNIDALILSRGDTKGLKFYAPDYDRERYLLPVGVLASMVTESGERIPYAFSMKEVARLYSDEGYLNDLLSLTSADRPEQVFKQISLGNDKKFQMEDTEMAADPISLPYLLAEIESGGLDIRFHTSREILDFCFKMKVPTSLTILGAIATYIKEDDFEKLDKRLGFKDVDELKKNLFAGVSVSAATSYALFKESISTMLRSAKEFGESSKINRLVESILNSFKDSRDLEFLEPPKQVQSSNVFVGEDEEELYKEMVVGEIKTLGQSFNPIKDNGSIIGVLEKRTQDGREIFILSSKKEFRDKFNSSSPAYVKEKIFATMLADVKNNLFDHSKRKFFFDSEQSFKELVLDVANN